MKKSIDKLFCRRKINKGYLLQCTEENFKKTYT